MIKLRLKSGDMYYNKEYNKTYKSVMDVVLKSPNFVKCLLKNYGRR